jgi:hypothetical protein
MFSYHTLVLLAEARRDDLLRQAQPQLRPVVPKRRWGSMLFCIVPAGRRRRSDRSAPVAAADPGRPPSST